ncbi:MAG: class I SAM-dependent methyltransferase [Acidimicrobiia bacterium]|nr:class I SAM-dependent methyltransferase [Acidimicrobiia bacterium]
MADDAPWSRFKSEIYSLIGRNPRSNRRLPSIADLASSHAVLDIGCGPGAAVRAAAPSVARAVGVDRSDAMVEIARRRSQKVPNAEFLAAGAEDLPFNDGEFDRIWTIHAFHHWEHPDQGIAECLRVLRPGGRFLIIEDDTKGVHGLDRARASGVVDQLLAAGFAEASVGKPYKQLVVTGVRGE